MSAVTCNYSPLDSTWVLRPTDKPPGSSLAKLSSGFRIDSGSDAQADVAVPGYARPHTVNRA